MSMLGFFIALIILTIFILSIGGIKTWSSGYKVNFIFNFVNGVKIGGPVRFAGVDVGQIKEIYFIAPAEGNKIRLVCWLSSEVKIPRDSTIWVNTLGLLGEKYIEVMPGKDYANCLAQGDSLTGIDPIPMHELFREARDIIGHAKVIVENLDDGVTRIKNKEGSLGKFIYDDAVHNSIDKLILDTDALILDIQKNPWKLFFKGKERK